MENSPKIIKMNCCVYTRGILRVSNKEMIDMSNKKKYTYVSENMCMILFLILMAFFIIFYRIMRGLPYNESGIVLGINFNMVAYLGSIVLALIIYIIAIYILKSRWGKIKIPLFFVNIWGGYWQFFLLSFYG